MNTATTTNRHRVADAIEAHDTIHLKSEIDYIIEVWGDDPDCQEEQFDIADAFHHVWTVAECNGERALVRACESVAVACGYLRPRSPGTRIFGRDRATIINGKRHDPACAWCLWIDQ